VIVYDVTDRESFEHVKNWMSDIDKYKNINKGLLRKMFWNSWWEINVIWKIKEKYQKKKEEILVLIKLHLIYAINFINFYYLIWHKINNK